MTITTYVPKYLQVTFRFFPMFIPKIG